jgi:hypothetical protein
VLADIDCLFSCPISNRSESADADEPEFDAGQLAAGYDDAELRQRRRVRLPVSDAIDVNEWVVGRVDRIFFPPGIPKPESRFSQCANVGLS